MKYSSKLNEFDILDLLNEYHSELRKLKHKMDYVKAKIADLETEYSLIKKIKDNALSVEKPESEGNFKRTTDAAEEQPKKERKPYPLSQWDKFIIESITANGHATLSKDIYASVKEKAIAANIFINDDKSKAKINQCLVKLTNRRNDLRKVKYKGRGFAYALPDWYDDRNRLKKEHKIK